MLLNDEQTKPSLHLNFLFCHLCVCVCVCCKHVLKHKDSDHLLCDVFMKKFVIECRSATLMHLYQKHIKPEKQALSDFRASSAKYNTFHAKST